jgi:3-isopropylmalate dehydrogenase
VSRTLYIGDVHGCADELERIIDAFGFVRGSDTLYQTGDIINKGPDMWRAMQIVKDPSQFDVIVTENMFGDILSDEASMVAGSLGMLSSASLNETRFGLYEPSGGSAPDIAGKGIANPIATILSAAMMLRYSFDLDAEADAIERAVKETLAAGIRTGDIMHGDTDGLTRVGTAGMGDAIAERIR